MVTLSKVFLPRVCSYWTHSIKNYFSAPHSSHSDPHRKPYQEQSSTTRSQSKATVHRQNMTRRSPERHQSKSPMHKSTTLPLPRADIDGTVCRFDDTSHVKPMTRKNLHKNYQCYTYDSFMNMDFTFKNERLFKDDWEWRMYWKWFNNDG